MSESSNDAVFPPNRRFHASVLVNDQVIVFGGKLERDYDDFYVTEKLSSSSTSTGFKWKKIQVTLPPLSNLSASSHHNKIYLFGGSTVQTLSNKLFELELLENSELNCKEIEYENEMIGIHKHSCCYYESEKRGHELIVFGGSTSSQEEKLINDIFIFNFDKNQWNKIETKNEAPSARYAHSASILNDKLWIFGGFDGKDSLQDVHSLSLDEFEWRGYNADGSKVSRRMNQGTCKINDNEFIIHGGITIGETVVSPEVLSDSYVFNTNDITWKPLDFNSPTACFAHFIFYSSEKLFVLSSSFSNDLQLRECTFKRVESNRKTIQSIWIANRALLNNQLHPVNRTQSLADVKSQAKQLFIGKYREDEIDDEYDESDDEEINVFESKSFSRLTMLFKSPLKLDAWPSEDDMSDHFSSNRASSSDSKLTNPNWNAVSISTKALTHRNRSFFRSTPSSFSSGPSRSHPNDLPPSSSLPDSLISSFEPLKHKSTTLRSNSLDHDKLFLSAGKKEDPDTSPLSPKSPKSPLSLEVNMHLAAKSSKAGDPSSSTEHETKPLILSLHQDTTIKESLELATTLQQISTKATEPLETEREISNETERLEIGISDEISTVNKKSKEKQTAILPDESLTTLKSSKRKIRRIVDGQEEGVSPRVVDAEKKLKFVPIEENQTIKIVNRKQMEKIKDKMMKEDYRKEELTKQIEKLKLEIEKEKQQLILDKIKRKELKLENKVAHLEIHKLQNSIIHFITDIKLIRSNLVEFKQFPEVRMILEGPVPEWMDKQISLEGRSSFLNSSLLIAATKSGWATIQFLNSPVLKSFYCVLTGYPKQLFIFNDSSNLSEPFKVIEFHLISYLKTVTSPSDAGTPGSTIQNRFSFGLFDHFDESIASFSFKLKNECSSWMHSISGILYGISAKRVLSHRELLAKRRSTVFGIDSIPIDSAVVLRESDVSAPGSPSKANRPVLNRLKKRKDKSTNSFKLLLKKL